MQHTFVRVYRTFSRIFRSFFLDPNSLKTYPQSLPVGLMSRRIPGMDGKWGHPISPTERGKMFDCSTDPGIRR